MRRWPDGRAPRRCWRSRAPTATTPGSTPGGTRPRATRCPPHLLEAGRAHAELTLAVLRGYGLRGEEATHAVRLIGSVLHGFTDLELSGSFSHSDPPSEESWPRAIAALDATLTRWGSA